jgi:hypothetical protein
MQKTVKRNALVSAQSEARRAADEQAELAFLAEFMRHDSVASLAGAIAERLGGNVCGNDLIAGARVDSNRGKR